MLKKIIIFLLSGLILLFILFLMGLISIKTISNKNIITQYLNKDILNMNSSSIINTDKSQTIKELMISLAIDSNIPKEIVDDLEKSNEFNELMGDFFKCVIEYTVLDKKKPTISIETINIITNVSDKSLEDHISIVMDEDELHDYIKDYVQKLNNLVPNNNVTFNYIILFKNFVSFNIIYLCIILSLLFLALLLVLKNLPQILKCMGVVILIAGVIFVIIGCFEGIIKVTDLTTHLFSQALNFCFKEGSIVTSIGILLMILSLILKRFYKFRL